MEKKLGLIHIYTGDGKGKTTAAFGLALRALGCGLKVLCIQFLKGEGPPSGEVKALEKVKGITVIRHRQIHPMFWRKSIRQDKARYADELSKLRSSLVSSIGDAGRLMKSRRYDLVILDEIINAASSKIIDQKIILDLIRSRPKDVELILTGRGASKELMAAADYVTQMQEIKHPYRRGIKSRQGIEI